MAALSRTCMFPARLASLRPLRQFVERFCSHAEVGNEECLRLNLVLEELFTNTVRHGHGGDTDTPAWLTLALVQREAEVEVTYEDAAPPFNPYAAQELSPERTGTLERRRLGGLGLILARRLLMPRSYAYLYGRNQTRLALPLRRE